MKKKPHEPEENVKYPRLVNEIGEKPEQYPFYDDEW